MNRETLAVLWRVFGNYRWQVALLVVLGVIGAFLDGIGINAVIPLVSFLLGSSAPTDFISVNIERVFTLLHLPFTFRFLALFIAGLFVLRAFVLVFFAKVRGRINGDYLRREGSTLYAATLAASWPFIAKQKIGYLQSTVLWDVKRTAALLDILVQLIQSLSGFAIYFLVAINISWTITLGTMAAGAVLMLLFRPLVRRSQQYGDQTSATEKSLAQHIVEHLGGFKVVKVSGVERPAADAAEKLYRRLEDSYASGIFIQQLSLVFFQPAGFLLVILLAGITYKTGTFNIAVFAAVLYLIQKIFTYLQSIQSSFHTVAEYVPYAHNIIGFQARTKAAADEEHAGRDFAFAKSLSFDSVSLTYEDGREALKDLSLTIKRGEVVGVIGPSGAGKTSFADLVLRLYRPTSGTIALDGEPVDSIATRAWRAHVGYVPQDVFLFNGTIRENIAFYRELSDEDIIEAAKEANIYDFVMGLPQGFDTPVGDRGVALSGGQRQRVALARVLAGKSELLVLDEATSALDTESEQLIHAALYRLRGRVTVIVIAHRLSTVADADRLLVFEKGRLAEEGTPAELRANAGSYWAQHSA